MLFFYYDCKIIHSHQRKYIWRIIVTQQLGQCDCCPLINLFSCDVTRFTSDHAELNVITTFKAMKPPITKLKIIYSQPLLFLGELNQKLELLRSGIFEPHKQCRLNITLFCGPDTLVCWRNVSMDLPQFFHIFQPY